VFFGFFRCFGVFWGVFCYEMGCFVAFLIGKGVFLMGKWVFLL
jgi:hypothetical protein